MYEVCLCEHWHTFTICNNYLFHSSWGSENQNPLSCVLEKQFWLLSHLTNPQSAFANHTRRVWVWSFHTPQLFMYLVICGDIFCRSQTIIIPVMSLSKETICTPLGIITPKLRLGNMVKRQWMKTQMLWLKAPHFANKELGKQRKDIDLSERTYT